MQCDAMQMQYSPKSEHESKKKCSNDNNNNKYTCIREKKKTTRNKNRTQQQKHICIVLPLKWKCKNSNANIEWENVCIALISYAFRLFSAKRNESVVWVRDRERGRRRSAPFPISLLAPFRKSNETNTHRVKTALLCTMPLESKMHMMHFDCCICVAILLHILYKNPIFGYMAKCTEEAHFQISISFYLPLTLPLSFVSAVFLSVCQASNMHTTMLSIRGIKS